MGSEMCIRDSHRLHRVKQRVPDQVGARACLPKPAVGSVIRVTFQWKSVGRFGRSATHRGRNWRLATGRQVAITVASLIGRAGSSAFRLSTVTASGSPAGACFSAESALRPFHHGIRRRGGTIYWAALPSNWTAGPSDQTNSPHPSSREGHHSTVGWISGFSPI